MPAVFWEHRQILQAIPVLATVCTAILLTGEVGWKAVLIAIFSSVSVATIIMIVEAGVDRVEDATKKMDAYIVHAGRAVAQVGENSSESVMRAAAQWARRRTSTPRHASARW